MKTLHTTTISMALMISIGCATPHLAPQRASKEQVGQAEAGLIYSAIGIKATRPHLPRSQDDFQTAVNRVHDLGFKVRTKGASLCRKKDREPVLGFYYNPPEKTHPVVATYITPDSPAEAVGLKVKDQFLQIKSTPIPEKRGHRTFNKALKRAKKAFQMTGDPIKIKVSNLNEDEVRTLSITPVEACKFTVRLAPDDQLNAYADGKNAVIFKGIYDLTENDSQLLTVIGHEMAHNSSLHVRKKKTNAAIGGFFGALLDGLQAYGDAYAGREYQGNAVFTRVGMAIGSRAWSKDFERDADYAGLYFAYLAGADLDESLRFWEIMHNAKEGDVGIPSVAFKFRGTHPSDGERYANMKLTIQEIREKLEKGEAVLPDLKKDAKKKNSRRR